MPNMITENSSKSELVLELIDVLKKETSLFETFLSLLERQQRALVENDLTGLNQVTELQREKIIEGGLLSGRREKVLALLERQENVMEDLTISKLIETVSSGAATALEQLRDTILDLHGRIRKVRSQNEMLINKSRENILKTLDLLGRFKIPGGGYQAGGTMKTGSTNLALDRRA